MYEVPLMGGYQSALTSMVIYPAPPHIPHIIVKIKVGNIHL